MKKEYIAMLCPICGETYFSETFDEKFDDPDDFKCFHCGWNYDLQQVRDPHLKTLRNQMSLEERKAWFQEQVKKDPSYDWLKANYKASPHKCPICGKYEFKDENCHDVCPYCGWEDDSLLVDEPDQWAGTSNDLCFNDFKRRYENLTKKKASYKYKKDGFDL